MGAAEASARPRSAGAHRHHHTAAHVQAVTDALRVRGVLTPELELAAWGHDLVYDPRATDSEPRSADTFDTWLVAQAAPADLRRDVRRLILATRHTMPPANRLEALLVDADLGILGASPPDFAAYDAANRREDAHVPGDADRAGRTRVLRHVLTRERIYGTPEFAALDARAQVNLRQALAHLEAG